jgi:hypothetical protein
VSRHTGKSRASKGGAATVVIEVEEGEDKEHKEEKSAIKQVALTDISQ